MDEASRRLIERSGYERRGFAAGYDAHRPRPPGILLAVLCRLAGTERPRLIVDLGCGTGLSARVWAGSAERVVGVEPQAAMLEQAREHTEAPNVDYVEAFAQETGLDEGAVDVVTCSQSLHWMEPAPTFAEAARILREGGVFAAYDYDVPPLVEPDVDRAFASYLAGRHAARERLGMPAGAARWRKDEHLARLEASGYFRWTREIALHHEEQGGVARVVGLARSIGPTLDDTEDEVESLRGVAEQALGDRVVPWLVSYRVRIGVV